MLVGCKISNSVLGESTYVGRGTIVENALILGNGAWMSDLDRKQALERGDRVYGVGEWRRQPAVWRARAQAAFAVCVPLAAHLHFGSLL